MRIQHNISALTAQSKMAANSAATSKSLEKLSSGYRINRAADDAAGLAISEKMRAQIRGLDMASSNAQNGISLIQTGDSSLNEYESILQRMRELATQGANGINADEDLSAIRDEATQLTNELDRIATTTEFNNKLLFNGDLERTASTSFANIDTATAANIANSQFDITLGKESGVSLASIDTVTAATDLNKFISGAKLDFKVSAGTNSGVKVDLSINGTAVGSVDDVDSTVTQLAFTGGAVEMTFDINNLDALQIGSTQSGTMKIATSASFVDTNGEKLNAFKEGISLHVGSNQDQVMDVSMSDLRINNSTGIFSSLSGIASKIGATLGKGSDAESAVSIINNAIINVSKERSKLGATQNRLEHTVSNLDTISENLTAAESRIRDVDMAKEMMEYTKNNILTQASQSMLAQANQEPQQILQLLR